MKPRIAILARYSPTFKPHAEVFARPLKKAVLGWEAAHFNSSTTKEDR